MNHGDRIQEGRDAARERAELRDYCSCCGCHPCTELSARAERVQSYSYARDPGFDLLWDYVEGQLALAGAVLSWLAPVGKDHGMVAAMSAHCQAARRLDRRGAPSVTSAPRCPYCERRATDCWAMPCLALSEILSEGHASVNGWLEATEAPFRVGEGN